MPSDRALRALNAMHRVVLRATRGRVGWKAARMPVLELTTTGRRTGKPRSTLLTSPLQVGESYLVVASRGGDDTHPGWYLNLRQEPRVAVVFRGGAKQRRIARVATPAERAELWPLVTRDHGNYARYQRHTDREIPLVLLDPVD